MRRKWRCSFTAMASDSRFDYEFKGGLVTGFGASLVALRILKVTESPQK